MDRLPPELLRMIADSIEQDPRPFTRQNTLAALARTNKTFHSICNSRLYQAPVLGNDRIVRKWARFYLSKVNPWTISKKCTNLRDLVLPESISFFGISESEIIAINGTVSPSSRYLKHQPAERYFVKLLFTPFLFQNLTSFSASSDRPVDHDFLAHLFGPVGSNRTLIKTLSIPLRGQFRLIHFLFEASSRLAWYWPGMDDMERVEALLNEIHDWDLQEKLREELNKWREDRTYDGLIENTLEEIAVDLGLVKYSVFKLLWECWENQVDEPWFIKDSDIRGHPFTSLVQLSLMVVCIEDIYLILYSSLFPSLRLLDLTGEIGLEVREASHDIKLLRFSITELEGTLVPPRFDSGLETLLHPVFVPDWTPLTTEEIEAEPKIHYFGPKLLELDLSGCCFE
ncbi:hypothetical protein JCM3765_006217 [Sporobolomyces pararoseus]